MLHLKIKELSLPLIKPRLGDFDSRKEKEQKDTEDSIACCVERWGGEQHRGTKHREEEEMHWENSKAKFYLVIKLVSTIYWAHTKGQALSETLH